MDAKVFGIGLSRTGTVSLTAALNVLGIEAVHYPNDAETQEELKAGHYRLSVLDRVQALTDIPVAPFYRQLDRAYPGSKFILTTRETEAWLTSVENHFRMYVEHRREPFDDFTIACTYGCLHFSAERFRDVKERHEAEVRAHFGHRPDDLLVMDVTEGGWDPLCSFLGVSEPDEPYPHRNRALSRPATGPSLVERARSKASGAVRRLRAPRE